MISILTDNVKVISKVPEGTTVYASFAYPAHAVYDSEEWDFSQYEDDVENVHAVADQVYNKHFGTEVTVVCLSLKGVQHLHVANLNNFVHITVPRKNIHFDDIISLMLTAFSVIYRKQSIGELRKQARQRAPQAVVRTNLV